MVAANLLGYFITSAASVPIVVQLAVAPLREVRVGTAFAALARHWRVFAGATLAVIAMTLGGAVLLVLPGIVSAIVHALYAPVAVMEGTSVRHTLRRARALTRRVWTSALVITAIQFAVPVLVWTASVKSSFVFKLADGYSPKELGFSFGPVGIFVAVSAAECRDHAVDRDHARAAVSENAAGRRRGADRCGGAPRRARHPAQPLAGANAQPLALVRPAR